MNYHIEQKDAFEMLKATDIFQSVASSYIFAALLSDAIFFRFAKAA